MRYLIAEYKTPEEALNEQHKILQSGVDQFNASLSDRAKKDIARYSEMPKCIFYEKNKSFVYYCKNCGAELWGRFSHSHWAAFSHGLSPYVDLSSRKNFEKFLEKHYDEFEKEERAKAEAACEKAVEITRCPICGAPLTQEKEYFLPPDLFSTKYETNLDKLKEEIEERFGEDRFDVYEPEDLFEAIAVLRELEERKQAKAEMAAYAKSCDLFVAEKESDKVPEVKATGDELKKYILHLIRLENNIYALEQRLSELYYRRIHSNRSVVLSVHEPAYLIKAELEKLRAAYQETTENVKAAEAYEPRIDVDYPDYPAAPILGKPGLFNKKKVLEENEALTARYQAAMEAYRKEVQRCDEEKARLIAEERAAVIGEAQAKADAAKAALDEAEGSLDGKIKALEARPVPAKAIKEVLDKEIKEAEDLLKKTFAARNELYAYNIIFGKYRDVVALSSFYEYLMAGRCTTLEGADGAYNIYENEVRMNLVISQLDTVISSLEDIKQNQYMMYEELRGINASLDSLNYTMSKALTSIQGIEANTNHMSEYMEHISQNSDVIAHNTAVTAHYSKVNAQLTNALGYMIAFN